jgi:hypothetical protein
MIDKNKILEQNGQKGNALFLILIAVALFAALSYAVTQSGRGGGTIDRETAMIAASQITQYPSTLRTAITRMVIAGTTTGTLQFFVDADDATAQGGYTYTAEDNIFASTGGGSVRQTPPSNVGATVDDWVYLDVLHASNGYYITGIGTDTDVDGRDVIAALAGISKTVCEQINKGLGIPVVTSVSPTVPTNTNTVTPANLPGTTTTGDDGAATKTTSNSFGWDYTGDANFAVSGAQAFACVKNGGDNGYLYYHALVEQ